MFFFRKHTPKLKELIPNGYTDIHCHVLPGIDDGAKNIQDSLTLLTEMHNMGFGRVVATPHIFPPYYRNTPECIQQTYESLIQSKNFKTIGIELFFAAEHMVEHEFNEHVQSEKFLTIGQNKHLLIETSFLTPPIFFQDVIHELIQRGYTPIIAHPERYSYYHKNFSLLEALKNKGCRLQLNLLSTTGYYGKEVCSSADALLAAKLYDFTGSDIHHLQHIKTFEKALKIKNTSNLEEVLYRNSKLEF